MLDRPLKARPFLLSLILFLVACGSESRPNPLVWEMGWNEMLAVVPDQDTLGSPPDQDTCQTALAAIRENTSELQPAPSVAIDDLVNEWVMVAEAAFFGCPPEGQDISSFDDAYAELLRIEEAIAAALES
ncbi:MAG TPA: hypothetical protein VFT85_01120 [Acidimicrobiia bacterium]|nr:hypothetical protein [Acidimicrobiia bacterium]